ncbi:fgf-3 [Hyphantria cunea granulovirus]|uniref:Fgf-3 n=1 Tax=Hyphantria cunea granulovirus TaxID=307448 RepID=A0AAE6D0F2_9BBAC|nr:fgf-3 [Hyphantria cunea granulovirus]QBQ01681.1 fgf-3 [Hyphantria cunea granulovirus]
MHRFSLICVFFFAVAMVDSTDNATAINSSTILAHSANTTTTTTTIPSTTSITTISTTTSISVVSTTTAPTTSDTTNTLDTNEFVEKSPRIVYFDDDSSVPLEYITDMIRLFVKIGPVYYHVTPYGKRGVGQFRSSLIEEFMASNIIRFQITNYDATTNNYVVLKFETTQKYLCMNHCADFYTTNTLNYDCVFIMVSVGGNSEYDSIVWYKKLNGELKTISYDVGKYTVASPVDFQQPEMNLKVMPTENVSEYVLNTIVDDPDGPLCEEYQREYVDDPINSQQNIAAQVDSLLLVILLVVGISSALLIIVIMAVMQYKKRKSVTL